MAPSDRIPRCRSLRHIKPHGLPGHLADLGLSLCPGGDVNHSRPVTAKMAVEILEMLNLPAVTASTIRTWADRGKVRKYGLDTYGLQKYELCDIMLAANESQPRQAQPA